MYGIKNMAGSWWREPAADEEDEEGGDAASRMWRNACGTLMAPSTDEAWQQIVESSPPHTTWHSLKNCVAHQAYVWQNLLAKGMDDVIQPAAFKLAIVLRHTPAELVVQLLSELLRLHPQSQDLTSYVLALLTDDEDGCRSCMPTGENAPISAAPLRDLQLFGDCEISVLAGTIDQYDAHAKLVRSEYARLSKERFVELRIRLQVLKQFTTIPKLYHTPEFEHLEKTARDNLQREIRVLREELLALRSNK